MLGLVRYGTGPPETLKSVDYSKDIFFEFERIEGYWSPCLGCGVEGAGGFVRVQSGCCVQQT